MKDNKSVTFFENKDSEFYIWDPQSGGHIQTTHGFASYLVDVEATCRAYV